MSVEAAGIAPVSDAELGEYAPIWVPDNRYGMFCEYTLISNIQN